MAKAEAQEDVRQAGVGIGLLVAGGLFVYTAIVALAVALLFVVSPNVDPITASLVIAGIFGVLGIVFALFGRTRVQVRPLEKSRESLKEDVEWAKHQTISREK